jgi:subtilisin family serine protease
MREYIVVANNEADIDSLHAELTVNNAANYTIDKNVIPVRSVEVANERLGNPRITHYFLSDEEAKKLSNDPRVQAIHAVPDPGTREKFVIQKSRAYNGVSSNFNRNATADKYNINWGLRRTSVVSTEQRAGTTYEYDVDGSGVDIVIMDDGIQVDHPEFLDATGTSRVQTIDWYAVTGIPGTMPLKHYDLINYGDGEHGTHVAAVVAGKTFGYAKNSRIYSIRIFGTNEQAIPLYDQFDLIRVFHQKKPVDPRTGFKRPTIVNVSWGYRWFYSNFSWWQANNIRKINYRGTVYDHTNNPVSPQIDYGQLSSSGAHGLLIPSVDAEQQDAENEGVIFVRAAGNYSHKIDRLDGIDYDNYYTIEDSFAGIIPSGDPIYYHRGGSPQSKNAILVSAARDIPLFKNRKYFEVVDDFSERGPGCDVVAPGTNICAATSKLASYQKQQEYVWGKNNANDRSNRVVKLTGTSMAAPQVTGVLALYLSKNPGATPAQCKAWISSTGLKNQIDSNSMNNDWSNTSSLLGGSNNFLHNPYQNRFKE